MHKKPIAVLQALPSLESGGVERGTIDIANALAIDKNFTSFVVSHGGKLTKQLHPNVIHVTLPLQKKTPITIYKNAKQLHQLIKKYHIDILHARSRAPAWSAYWATQKTDCHFMTTFHGTYSHHHKLKKYYNSIMTRGEITVAVSHFIKHHIEQHYSNHHNPITVIPRGTDTNFFNPENVTSHRIETIQNYINLPVSKLPLIIMPGRLTYWKGQDFLLESLTEIKHIPFQCLLVGDEKKHSNYTDIIRRKIQTLQLSNKVHIIGNIIDMPALYTLADCVICASIRPEAFGRICTEAGAMEKIMIATDHGGASETIRHDQTGFLTSPTNPKHLAETLKKILLLSPDDKKTIGQAARNHVIKNFSLENMVNLTLSAYHTLASQPK